MDKDTSGENKNVKGALAYLVGPLTGVFFLLTEKKNDFIRFHAMQSVLLFGALIVLHVILMFSLIGLIVIPFLMIAEFVLWILLMWKAFNGEMFVVPVVGEFAKKQLEKMK